jgi:hypothetical protein
MGMAHPNQASEERNRAMKIIGCDLHTRYQQIAMLDQKTGELIERRLEQASGEVRSLYACLAGAGTSGVDAQRGGQSVCTLWPWRRLVPQ